MNQRGRPLTCTALKPIGSTPEQLAMLCSTFARAGLDLIKDDHGWADQASAPFEARVQACQRAVEASGAPSLYLPSLFGHYGQMQRQIELLATRQQEIASGQFAIAGDEPPPPHY